MMFIYKGELLQDEKTFDEYSPSAPAILLNSVGQSRQEHKHPSKTNHTSLRADVCFESSPSSGSCPAYLSRYIAKNND